jgi:bifunctional lysine-specific demethylase and histidyl-hydroxylase NO66
MAPLDGGLAWLLDPVEPASFFEHYETAPLHVRRDDPARFVGVLGLEDVDFLLTSTVSNRMRPTDGERLVRAEADGSLSERPVVSLPGSAGVDVQAVYRAYHEGFTVIVNQVHRRFPPVAHLCRGLQAELHHPVGANLYLTPARSQGFLPHADTHDVFIMQLHGSKEWHISAPRDALPLANTKDGRHTLPDAQAYVLVPGDVLYLPRGFPHAALTGPGSSMHLTVGLDAFRWHDVFREALDLAAESDLAFRAAVPGRYFDAPFSAEQVGELAARLISAMDDASFLERVRERMRSRLVANSVPAGFSRFASLDALPTLEDRSVVRRDPAVTCVVRVGDEATIEFLSNYVTGPLAVEPAFRFVAANERFAVAELPGSLPSMDKIDLVRRLISEGLLEVDNR